VNGPILKEKAIKYAEELGIENFKASNAGQMAGLSDGRVGTKYLSKLFQVAVDRVPKK
jgi:hypothetical protein